MPEIISKSAAIEAGRLRYYTAIPCKNGHDSERYVIGNKCIRCMRNGHKRWRVATPERRRAWNRTVHSFRKAHPEKYRSEPRYKITQNLRTRLRRAMRRGSKAGSAVRALGCPVSEFQAYIAGKFTNGMTWSNYGEWQLDHIRPLAKFNLSDPEDFAAAWHFSNYQPLWACENRLKGAT